MTRPFPCTRRLVNKALIALSGRGLRHTRQKRRRISYFWSLVYRSWTCGKFFRFSLIRLVFAPVVTLLKSRNPRKIATRSNVILLENCICLFTITRERLNAIPSANLDPFRVPNMSIGANAPPLFIRPITRSFRREILFRSRQRF